jgi:undecaprenyl-diphosphatase
LSWIQALILGLVQGLTEFLPVSSSAHLKIAKKCLGIADGESLLFFDLICHVGTWAALVIYLRRDIWKVLCSLKQISLFSLALVPLVPAYFLLKPLRTAFSDPSYLGYFLFFTGALLYLASRKKVSELTLAPASSPISPSVRPPKKWRDVLCIGGMQALALIPGISRSGSTLAAARFCGWPWRDAARFSFLLAVPTIFGGFVLEMFKPSESETPASLVSLGCYGVGFLAAFGLGLASVRLIFWVYEKGNVRPFAWYCLGMGILAMAFF